MTNETTASQPKSIGDDARLEQLFQTYYKSQTVDEMTTLKAAIIGHIVRAPAAQASATIQFLHNVCADVLLALRNCDRQPLADLLESALRDLPASATIQAAPEGREIPHDENLRVQYESEVRADLYIGMERNIFGAFKDTTVEQNYRNWIMTLKYRPAATIQEPVMVAEPVAHELMQQLGTMRAVFHTNMLRAYPEKSHAEITVEIDRALGAAPMVADPAGVSRRATDAEVAAWAERHDITNRLGNLARDAFEDAESLHMTYAATVKAVPSEALDADCPSCDPSTRFICHRCKGRGKIAAPLADKTGGGE